MNNSIAFTKHAFKRCQQRAIPPFIVDLIIDYGRITRRHSSDVYYLDKNAKTEIKRLLGRKIYARVSDQLNVFVVLEGEVLTVAHRTKRTSVKH